MKNKKLRKIMPGIGTPDIVTAIMSATVPRHLRQPKSHLTKQPLLDTTPASGEDSALLLENGNWTVEFDDDGNASIHPA